MALFSNLTSFSKFSCPTLQAITLPSYRTLYTLLFFIEVSSFNPIGVPDLKSAAIGRQCVLKYFTIPKTTVDSPTMRKIAVRTVA